MKKLKLIVKNSFYSLIILGILFLAIDDYLRKQNEFYLMSSLTLKENENFKLRKKGNTVKVIYRDKEKIVTKIEYVPQEGSVQVIEKECTQNKPNTTYEITNKGITNRWGYGL